MQSAEATLGVANTSIVELPGPPEGQDAQGKQEDELGGVDDQTGEVKEHTEQDGLEYCRPCSRRALGDWERVWRGI